MNPLANTKTVVSLMGSPTNGETVTANIDTLDFDYASIDVIMGTSNTASNNPSTLKLSESDDTVVTNFSDITEAVGDGVGGWTIPNASTSAPNLYRFNVDCRARKRYLRLTVTPLTTQLTVLSARLGKGVEAADRSTTTMGVSAVVNI